MNHITKPSKIYPRKNTCSFTTQLMILSTIFSVICFIGWNLFPINTNTVLTKNSLESDKQTSKSEFICDIMEDCNSFEFIDLKEDDSKNFHKYRIKVPSNDNINHYLTYQDVISMLKSNVQFRNKFFDILRLGLASKNEKNFAYFFEVRPITKNIYSSTPFEFVIIPAPLLDGIKADQR